MATPLTAREFEWGAASLTLPGESECGDKPVVEAFEHRAMVAMVDALGHGREAAHAANVAAQTLSRYAREDPVALIERCHGRLRDTRGAAICIAVLDAHRRTVSWIGVGNVQGLLVSADPRATPRVRELLQYGGVVGDRLPELTPSELTLSAGDTLVLTTDGLWHCTHDVLTAAMEPQPLAERILGRFAKRTDDAAVLVISLNGGR